MLDFKNDFKWQADDSDHHRVCVEGKFRRPVAPDYISRNHRRIPIIFADASFLAYEMGPDRAVVSGAAVEHAAPITIQDCNHVTGRSHDCAVSTQWGPFLLSLTAVACDNISIWALIGLSAE